MKFLTLAPLLLAASVVAKEYPYCEGCDVIDIDGTDNTKYGVENNDWCKINEGKCQFSECPNCNAFHVDMDGLFGTNNGDWCYMSFDKCNNKLPVCETCKVYDTYKNVKYGQENDRLCKINEGKCQFSECPNCDAIHVDMDGLFGTNNGDWCYMSFKKCNKELPYCETCEVYETYNNIKYGRENEHLCKISESRCAYPECKYCNALEVDKEDGLFGVNGDEWCHMFFDKCNNEIPLCKTCTVYANYHNVKYGQEDNHLCRISEIRCSYPVCKNTCEVYFTDENGDFGIENDDWCVVDEKKCKK